MASSDSDEDRIERDKFADRLKRKDKERTRNIAVPRSGTFNIAFNRVLIHGSKYMYKCDNREQILDSFSCRV